MFLNMITNLEQKKNIQLVCYSPVNKPEKIFKKVTFKETKQNDILIKYSGIGSTYLKKNDINCSGFLELQKGLLNESIKITDLLYNQEEQLETKYMLALFEHPQTCAYLLGLEKGILDGEKLLKQNIKIDNLTTELKLATISGTIFGNKKTRELEIILQTLKEAFENNNFENVTQQIFRNSVGLPFEIIGNEFNLFYKHLKYAIQNDIFHIPTLKIN